MLKPSHALEFFFYLFNSIYLVISNKFSPAVLYLTQCWVLWELLRRDSSSRIPLTRFQRKQPKAMCDRSQTAWPVCRLRAVWGHLPRHFNNWLTITDCLKKCTFIHLPVVRIPCVFSSLLELDYKTETLHLSVKWTKRSEFGLVSQMYTAAEAVVSEDGSLAMSETTLWNQINHLG